MLFVRKHSGNDAIASKHSIACTNRLYKSLIQTVRGFHPNELIAMIRNVSSGVAPQKPSLLHAQQSSETMCFFYHPGTMLNRQQAPWFEFRTEASEKIKELFLWILSQHFNCTSIAQLSRRSIQMMQFTYFFNLKLSFLQCFCIEWSKLKKNFIIIFFSIGHDNSDNHGTGLKISFSKYGPATSNQLFKCSLNILR